MERRQEQPVYFYEETDEFVIAESIVRICGGCYGGCIYLEPADPGDGTVGSNGKLAFLPATIGFWLGIIFLLLIDTLMPHLHIDSKEAEGVKSNFKRTTMMVFAIIIHNIPEGMAVGVVYAGWISGSTNITLTAALALSIGIAIQNLPEGAIVSMPLCSEGCSKTKAFGYGFFSGIVEPIAALLTIALSSIMVPVLPYFLGFAAGAMLYVVVEELIPEMAEGEHTNLGTIMFAVGFSLMMVLDVALG